MKISVKYFVVVSLAIIFFSCKKDNYDAPSSTLSGHLLYQSDTIYLEKEQVPVLIYQYGFGKVGPVGQLTQYRDRSYTSVTPTFAQDGGYSLLLYDGDYKIVIPNGQGPFLWKQTATGNPDTVSVTLHGSQTVDLQVTPYYMVRNTQISASGGNISATFKAEKIIVDANAKNIERVSLYINKTQFVSGGNDYIAVTDLAGSNIIDPNNITLSVTIPSMTPTQNYVFARVGIKIADVEDMIFSPLQKISF